MNYKPFEVIIGSVLRHFLTIAAGYLFAYGVTQEEANAAVAAAVTIGVAAILSVATLGWSYISKRIAFETPTEGE